MSSERVKWIDVAKFIGIFTIYLGHYMTEAGNAYLFVFQFHVPLFFFLAGCTACYDTERNPLKFVYKKFKQLLVPFFIFGITSLLFWFVYWNADLTTTGNQLMIVLRGCIRDTYFAPGLWFITCLFVMSVAFRIIRYVRFRVLMLVICAAISVLSITQQWYTGPKVPYNLDSMLYYIFFYGLGYAVYPGIRCLMRMDTLVKKLAFLVTGLVCLWYALNVYVSQDPLYAVYVKMHIYEPTLSIIHNFVKPLPLIWCVLCVSKLFENVPLFTRIGKESLFLCGNEYILNTLLLILLTFIGGTTAKAMPMFAFVYTMLVLLLGVYVWIPLEKRAIASVVKVFSARKQPAAADGTADVTAQG